MTRSVWSAKVLFRFFKCPAPPKELNVDISKLKKKEKVKKKKNYCIIKIIII
jgi:hypothetical protein